MSGTVVKISNQQRMNPSKPLYRRPGFWVALMVFIALLALVVVAVKSCGSQESVESVHEGYVQAPMSSSDANGQHYQDVMLRFENAGFTNVTSEPINDLVFGFMHKEGDVDTVSVGGDTDYDADSWFDQDVKVVVRYHAFMLDEEKEPVASETSEEDAVPEDGAEESLDLESDDAQ